MKIWSSGVLMKKKNVSGKTSKLNKSKTLHNFLCAINIHFCLPRNVAQWAVNTKFCGTTFLQLPPGTGKYFFAAKMHSIFC